MVISDEKYYGDICLINQRITKVEEAIFAIKDNVNKLCETCGYAHNLALKNSGIIGSLQKLQYVLLGIFTSVGVGLLFFVLSFLKGM